MLVFLDIDTDLLILSPGQRSAVLALTVPFGSGVPLRIQPVRNGLPVVFSGTPALRWIGKALATFEGDTLCYADNFVFDSATGHYVAVVGYNTPGLENLLDIGGAGNAYVKISAQVAWHPDGITDWRPSQVVTLTVHNSVWRDDAPSPEVPPNARAPRWYPDVVGLTGGGLTKLDGIPTVAMEVGALAVLVIEDVLSSWVLMAGTEAEDVENGKVRPDDYNGGTNAKYWLLAASSSGDVTGPAVSENNELVTFDGETGKAIKQTNAFLTPGNLEIRDPFDPVYVYVTLSTTAGLRWQRELAAVGIEPPGSLDYDWTLYLPSNAGNAGDVLTNNGSGVTVWNPGVRRGSGSPQGVLTAPVGTLYSRADGGAGTTLYVKESGSGNTGWVAK